MWNKLCKKAKVPPFKLHQLRHLATAILKDEADMSLAKLQRFLRHDHQRTTEIYAGHIETGAKKQTDFLADFWANKLDLNKGNESIPEIINQEK
jgi:integrase